jgi:hypothetical protein
MFTRLAGLVCLLWLVSNGYAQSMHRVLISTHDTSGVWCSADSLQIALSHWFTDTIITRLGTIPDSLDRYDAIFTELREDVGEDSAMQLRRFDLLTRYLQHGGRVYFDCRNVFGMNVSIYPTLDSILGVIQPIIFQTDLGDIYEIDGVTGAFTEGLHISRKAKQLGSGPSGPIFISRNAKSVLTVHGVLGGGTSVAWNRDTLGARIILDLPTVRESYDQFMGRVICNYFGLCEPLAVQAPVSSETSSITYGSSGHVLITRISALSEAQHICVYSILGNKVFAQSLRPDQTEVGLPASLPNGAYVAVVLDALGHQLFAKPFVKY